MSADGPGDIWGIYRNDQVTHYNGTSWSSTTLSAPGGTPIFEENGPENFKGVDIMRAVRSFDPCLPCGVHMYTGKGKVRKVIHTPTGLS